MKKTFLISMLVTIGGIAVTVVATLATGVVAVVTPEIRCELLDDCPRKADKNRAEPPALEPPPIRVNPPKRVAPARAPRGYAPPERGRPQRRHGARDVLFVGFDLGEELVGPTTISLPLSL